MSKIEKRIVVSPGVERLYTYLPEARGLVDIWPGLLEVGEVSDDVYNLGFMSRGQPHAQ